eukprot:Protomagalhaensia_sp_Gyna_25__5647@NODE_795_length_2604_cov_6_499025_g626_i0_p1_GENE_NODE_795_length_2604_cov_6_499025_g626_i0NODE_795_length_2604_cov_6_499025_g626_i0_p1_ORF_typecomplete_len840_score149_99_NODE_795_length_2604_cov_6_499025_g626_i0472566
MPQSIKVPQSGINETIPKLQIEDYINQPGLQLSSISYEGQHEDEAGGDINDILDQLKQMDEYFSNVDVQHVGNKLLDREDLQFLCKPSVACPHVPPFFDIFANFQAVMPEPKQVEVPRNLEEEENSLLASLIKEATAQTLGDDEESVDAVGEDSQLGSDLIESAKPLNTAIAETPLSPVDSATTEDISKVDPSVATAESEPLRDVTMDAAILEQTQVKPPSEKNTPTIDTSTSSPEEEEEAAHSEPVEGPVTTAEAEPSMSVAPSAGSPEPDLDAFSIEKQPEPPTVEHRPIERRRSQDLPIPSSDPVYQEPPTDHPQKAGFPESSTPETTKEHKEDVVAGEVETQPTKEVETVRTRQQEPDAGEDETADEAVKERQENLNAFETSPSQAVVEPVESSKPRVTPATAEQTVSKLPEGVCGGDDDDVPESTCSEPHMVVHIPVFGADSANLETTTLETPQSICGSVLPAVQTEWVLSSPRWSASLVGPDGFHYTCSQVAMEKNQDARALWMVGAQFSSPGLVPSTGDLRRLGVKLSVVLGGLVERGEESPSAPDRRIEDSTDQAHAYGRRHSAPAFSDSLRTWVFHLYDSPSSAVPQRSYHRHLRSQREIRDWADHYEANRRWEWNRNRLRTSPSRETSPSYTPIEQVRLRQGERQARLDRDYYHEETERKFQAQLEAVRARMRRAAAKKGKLTATPVHSHEIKSEQKQAPLSPQVSSPATKIAVVKPADQAPIPPKRHQLPPRTTPNAPTVSVTEQTTDFRHVLKRTGRLEALRTGRLNVPTLEKDQPQHSQSRAVLTHKAMKPSDARDMFERKAREQARTGEAPSEWFLKQVSKYQKA